MNDIVLRALIAASVVLAFLGIACLTRPHREKPRNVRRESGNTVPRMPNVRRPLAASCDCDAEARNAEIRALIAAPSMSVWTDEPTLTSPRGES